MAFQPATEVKETIHDRVAQLLSDGKPRTLSDICSELGIESQTGLSARIRDLRKQQFGGHEVMVIRTKDKNYFYWLRS